MMYRLDYEATVGERRKASSELLPLTCGISHALAEVACVLADQTYRLDKLILAELHVQENEYRVKRTLVRYERDGL